MPGLFNCQNSSRSASNGCRKKVIQTPSLNNNNNNNKSINPSVIFLETIWERGANRVAKKFNFFC